MTRWQLQQAKNRFSEVVDHALEQGPQIVTRRGVDTVVVLSLGDYEKLIRPEVSLVEFFQGSPLVGVELDLERSKDLPREVDI